MAENAASGGFRQGARPKAKYENSPTSLAAKKKDFGVFTDDGKAQELAELSDGEAPQG